MVDNQDQRFKLQSIQSTKRMPNKIITFAVTLTHDPCTGVFELLTAEN
jgi:hypothetical protein